MWLTDLPAKSNTKINIHIQSCKSSLMKSMPFTYQTGNHTKYQKQLEIRFFASFHPVKGPPFFWVSPSPFLHIPLSFDKIKKDAFSKIIKVVSESLNPLSANPTKWSNTLKQFVGKLPTNCLSVFDRFVGLALKGLSDLHPN